MKNKSPLWFWITATISLLWNIIGLLSFVGHLFIAEFGIQELTNSEVALYDEYSWWTHIVFAVAVFSGFVGSLGLLLRKHWSYTAFIASLLAVIPQMIHSVFFTSSIEVYGLAKTITMPIIVILFALFLIWFSKRSVYSNWYR